MTTTDINTTLRSIVANSVKSETPTPEVPEPTELDKLAASIRLAHKDVVSNARNMIVKAMDAGALLIQAKQKVKAGTWMAWLQENCRGISDRTARLYIQLAEGRESIEAQMKKELATVANSTPTFKQAIEWAKGDTASEATTTVEAAAVTKTETIAEEPQTSTELSDKYDKAEDNLITKLQSLSVDNADAAAAKTIERLHATVAAIKAKAFDAATKKKAA